MNNSKKTDPAVKNIRCCSTKILLEMEYRKKMPYEEDKLQGVTEEENHDKKREKKKPLTVFI